MKIYIGADHRGFKLKAKITKHLQKKGHEVFDVGVNKEGVICDYPAISHNVARKVVRTKDARGILVCMTGIGHSIAANKIPGAHAALCYTKKAAEFSRQHNNSNILVLGARFVSQKTMMNIIDAWMKAEFEGGRHLRRVRQIKKIEQGYSKKRR